MKSKRTLFIFAGIIALVVATGLIIRAREPYAFEEVSRFARLGPEGELSNAEVQEILQQSTQGPVVVTSVKNDVSESLEAIPVIPPKQSKPDPDLNELRPLPKRGGGATNRPPGKFVDPVLQEGSASIVNISSPLQNFDGVSNVNGVLPPDTNGDVGPNHYMQWVNLSFAIYSKSGALLYGPAAGNTLWSGFGAPCQTSNDGDPIVQYDHLADRWMVSQFALPNYPSGPFYQCIAVSQTGNPTGAWYRYAFQISATKLNDYPHFGVWSDGYYMSINQFVGNTWAGAGAVAFERDKMLQGLPAQAVYFDLFSVDPNLGGMLPSDLDGQAPPAGTPNYFMQADDNGFGYPQDQLEIWAFSVNWANPGSSTFTNVGNLATAAFDSDMCAGSRNCIPQQGTTRRLDAIADRLMYRLQYRNFGSYQTIVANHTVDVNSADRAGIRWYELRNSGSGWSIFQQGTFSPDATHRWMGSAAMDGSGNIGLGYSASSSTMFAAVRYTGRLAGDPLGTLPQGEGTIINGTGAQTHTASRWGDYSMLAVDPVDGCTFWYTNEYIQTTGSAPWRTRIGSFQLPGCGSGPTTGTLQGTVTDATTSATISGATVTIVGGASTSTDTTGFYQFTNVAPGTYTVTAAKTGYNTSTNTGVSIMAGTTTTSNFALTPATTISTGFLAPSAQAAQTSSAGDNNGYQTNPTNVFADDSVFAVDTNSGTNSNTSCTSNRKDKHHFFNYNFSIPGTAVVKGLEVRLDALADATSGSPHICVQISWNGGTTWTTAKQTSTLSTTEATYVLGASTDAWGHTWASGNFSNTNFRVRVIDVASNTSRNFSLDYIAVNVTYQP